MEEIVSDEEKKRRSRKARAMNKARALQAIQRPVEERKPTKLADITSRDNLKAFQSDLGDGSQSSYDSTQSDPGPGAPSQAEIRREARDARLRKIMDKKRMRLMSIQTASERAAGGVKISPSGPGPALAEIFDSIMRPADLPAPSDPRGLEQKDEREHGRPPARRR